MSIRRKRLKEMALLMMGMAAAFAPVNPKELEEKMRIMNEQKIEFSIPADSDDGDGDGNKWWIV